jgi:hypothetical protein
MVRCDGASYLDLALQLPMTPDTLDAYQKAADRLLDSCDKRTVADAARLLALYVGHYQRRHGPIGIEALADLTSALPTSDHREDRAEGMRALAAALTLSAGLAHAAIDET